MNAGRNTALPCNGVVACSDGGRNALDKLAPRAILDRAIRHMQQPNPIALQIKLDQFARKTKTFIGMDQFAAKHFHCARPSDDFAHRAANFGIFLCKNSFLVDPVLVFDAPFPDANAVPRIDPPSVWIC